MRASFSTKDPTGRRNSWRIDPTARRNSWRCKQQLSQNDFEFGSVGSVGGIAGSSTIGTMETPDKGTQKVMQVGTPTATAIATPATAIATPITRVSEYSPSAVITPRTHFTFCEEEDSQSIPWSVDPGTFNTRDPPGTATPTTVNAVPVSPTLTAPSPPGVSPLKHPRPSHRRDTSLYSTEDSVLPWSDDPEKDYFQYILRHEQEQRAIRGKPAEGSLLGESTIEEMINAGPLAILGVDNEVPNSTMEGFSLATTEKSGGELQLEPVIPSSGGRSVSMKSMHLSTISSKSPWPKRYTRSQPDTQSQLKDVPLHQQGEQNFGKVLPDVIYVLEKDSNLTVKNVSKVCGPKGSSCEDKEPEPNRILFVAITFVLCGIMLAGAAVAIYFSQFYNETNPHNSTTSQQAITGSQGPSIDITGVNIITSQIPSSSPSLPSPVPVQGGQTPKPTSKLEGLLSETEEPTAEETYGGTDPPTWKPSQAPTILPSRSPSMLPSEALTLEPNEDDVSSTPAFNNVAECGCQECVNVLDNLAGGVPCRERIYFLVVRWGMEPSKACRTVAGEEFPNECSSSLCDPTQCTLLEEDLNATPPKPEPTPTPQPTLLPIPTLAPKATSQPNAVIILTELPAVTPSNEPTTQVPTPEPTTPRPTLRPTTLAPEPTSTPTQRPTSLELDRVGNNGSPSEVYPLRRCEGDCDADEECAEGLVCYQRDERDPVPGCRDGEEENSNTDFCVPEWATLPPTDQPTPRPTRKPTPKPTSGPTDYQPTDNPTFSPTQAPTDSQDVEEERSFLQDFTCDMLGVFC